MRQSRNSELLAAAAAITFLFSGCGREEQAERTEETHTFERIDEAGEEPRTRTRIRTRTTPAPRDTRIETPAIGELPESQTEQTTPTVTPDEPTTPAVALTPDATVDAPQDRQTTQVQMQQIRTPLVSVRQKLTDISNAPERIAPERIEELRQEIQQVISAAEGATDMSEGRRMIIMDAAGEAQLLIEEASRAETDRAYQGQMRKAAGMLERMEATAEQGLQGR